MSLHLIYILAAFLGAIIIIINQERALRLIANNNKNTKLILAAAFLALILLPRALAPYLGFLPFAIEDAAMTVTAFVAGAALALFAKISAEEEKKKKTLSKSNKCKESEEGNSCD